MTDDVLRIASRRRARRWLASLAVALAAAVAVGAFTSRQRRRPRVVRIATGLRGGTFLPLGEELAKTFQRDLPRYRARALESPGGAATVRMLDGRACELALVSNNVHGGDSLRLIAPLYEETLQVVVRRAVPVATALDLRGRRVSVGPSGSGTEAVAWQVLRHFGLGEGDVTARTLSPLDAEAALARGDLDAAFFVAGMRTPVVERLLQRDDMRLLALGDPTRQGSALEGIRLDAPFLAVTVIPERAYGRQPEEPVGTVSVRALLVARADLDEDLVQDLTQSLFANKVRLAQRERLLARLSERFDPADSPYPLHPGADRYYRRDEPSFVARYADLISLAITLGALFWSGVEALRAARRRSRQGRIETYYHEAQAIGRELVAATSPAEVRAVRDRLVALRARAFDDLMAERLAANESFTIFQDYLRAQLAETERALAA